MGTPSSFQNIHRLTFTDTLERAGYVPLKPLEIVTLEIFFKNHHLVSLILKEKSKLIDSLDFAFDRNLETMLISWLDKILIKNRMSLSSLKIVKITGEIEKDSLSFQIAQSFKKALIL